MISVIPVVKLQLLLESVLMNIGLFFYLHVEPITWQLFNYNDEFLFLSVIYTVPDYDYSHRIKRIRKYIQCTSAIRSNVMDVIMQRNNYYLETRGEIGRGCMWTASTHFFV